MTSADTAQDLNSASGNFPGNNLIIRDARPSDAPAIQHIYAWHVLHGTATFEEVVPSTQEMQERLTNIIAQGLPYLVAELDGQVVGYSYAAPYRTRSAFRYTLENSIYLAHDQTAQ